MARLVIVSGFISPCSTMSVIQQLMELDMESHAPIAMLISSGGGSLESGYAVCSTMKAIESPVITMGYGLLASAATLIHTHGEKGRRMLAPNSRYMIHQLSSFTKADAISLNGIRDAMEEVVKSYSNCTGRTMLELERMLEFDNYMSAEEAIHYGFADAIINPTDPTVST